MHRPNTATADLARSHTLALDAYRTLADAVGLDPAGCSPYRDGDGRTRLTSLVVTALNGTATHSNELMNASDGLLAEAVNREVTATTHHQQNFASADKTVLETALNFGTDFTDTSLRGTSGLSTRNRLTTKHPLSQMLNIAANSNHRQLSCLIDLLPVVNRSGTLTPARILARCLLPSRRGMGRAYKDVSLILIFGWFKQLVEAATALVRPVGYTGSRGGRAVCNG
ncbi:hypothetical protein DIJ64_12145 [Mycobacterium leprae]|uniref:Uncharacterized protein n=2 Tax=Mycobacterium leprae TaxID=1769 RepID=O05758_MYCLR|nr:hypothetical protein DIJ64_12145 [Mycobacterium leprae]OAR20016.1 hypothetical protein A8144_03460 [Mycobacterium leprae 3125609]OAX71465.1 hypothetical protein A3216_05540 [Mycobacterium leprae 7935681]CAB08430.1 unknown [Mycobacterium leprae]